MNYIEVQQMRKQAGLFGNTMLGRAITNAVGPHTFVSDALGASQQDIIDHEAKQLGFRAPSGGTPNDAYNQAARRLDRNLALAQQRIRQQEAAERKQQLAQQQAAASKRNENLMAAYMAGNNQQLQQQNQFAAQGNAATNQRLASNVTRARQQVAANRQREQQQQTANNYIAMRDAQVNRAKGEQYSRDLAAAKQQQTANQYTAQREAIKNRALGEQYSRDLSGGYQQFNSKDLRNWDQDKINAISAAARKAGIKMNQVSRVRMNNGQVTGINGIGLS